MKIALVHDYLIQYGGAERVLECITEIWPYAPIYTLIYDEEKTHGIFKNKRIYTSFLQNFPYRSKERSWNVVTSRHSSLTEIKLMFGAKKISTPLISLSIFGQLRYQKQRLNTLFGKKSFQLRVWMRFYPFEMSTVFLPEGI